MSNFFWNLHTKNPVPGALEHKLPYSKVLPVQKTNPYTSSFKPMAISGKNNCFHGESEDLRRILALQEMRASPAMGGPDTPAILDLGCSRCRPRARPSR
jgi:hypothetical protein